MIKNILSLLNQNDFKGESELIDIAKGKYKKPSNIKDVYTQFKRELGWLSRKP